MKIEDFRVILDLGPASKGHALILPKQHFKDLCELDPAIAAKALPLAGKIGAAMKKDTGLHGFQCGSEQWHIRRQTVFHFHVHIIPRYENGTGYGDMGAREKQRRKSWQKLAAPSAKN